MELKILSNLYEYSLLKIMNNVYKLQDYIHFFIFKI